MVVVFYGVSCCYLEICFVWIGGYHFGFDSMDRSSVTDCGCGLGGLAFLVACNVQIDSLLLVMTFVGTVYDRLRECTAVNCFIHFNLIRKTNLPSHT